MTSRLLTIPLDPDDIEALVLGLFEELQESLSSMFEVEAISDEDYERFSNSTDDDSGLSRLARFQLPSTTEGLEAAPDNLRVFGPANDASHPIVTVNSAAISWRLEVKHTGQVQGIRATYRHVRLNGCTLIDKEKGQITQFVDWIAALAQMGVGVSSRPNLSNEEGKNAFLADKPAVVTPEHLQD